MVTEKLIGKIKKLFALGQSPNKHEAEAAVVAAFELMAKHDIEMSQIDFSAPKEEIIQDLMFETGRVSNHVWSINTILQKYFQVFIMRRTGYIERKSKIYMVGKKSRIELAKHIYNFIQNASERSWQEHRKGIVSFSKADTMYQKRSYMEGFISGIENKLKQSKSNLEEKGLVLVQDSDLLDFKNKKVKTSFVTVKDTDYSTWAKGYETGFNTDLFTPVGSANTTSKTLC